MDIFKPFKDKIKKDFTEFVKKKFNEFKSEFIAMAKTLDVDKDGITDVSELESDFKVVVEGFSSVSDGTKKIVKAGSNFCQLAMCYYVVYGVGEKPSLKLEKLQSSNIEPDDNIQLISGN